MMMIQKNKNNKRKKRRRDGFKDEIKCEEEKIEAKKSESDVLSCYV